MNKHNSLIDSHFSMLKLEKSRKTSTVNINESTLFFLLSGTILVSYEGKMSEEVPGGSVFLLQANSYLQVQTREQARLILCPFLPESYFAENEAVELFNASSAGNVGAYPLRGRMTEFLSLLFGYLEDKEESKVLYAMLKQGLFILFRLHYSKEELSRFFAPVIGKDVAFKDFVLKNCLHVETVEQLASLANYSTSGFEKRFFRCFNESPYKWILKYKAKRILQDIQLSHKPFKDIAEEYGFSSQSYFYTFCRRHYENSPREIRKQSKDIVKRGWR